EGTARRRRSLFAENRWVGLALAIGLSLPPVTGLASDVVSREFNAAIQDRANLMHGESIFNDTCIRCHGPDGAGSADGTIAAIAGQHSRYVIRQLVDF